MKIHKFTIDNENGRIDKIISEKLPDLTRSYIAKLIDDKAVLINSKPAKKSDKIKQNDEITITVPEPVSDKAVPQEIPLDIVYEDSDLLVVNKQKGMVVHPAAGNRENTLVNALLYHCGAELSGINGVSRPGIVHRIDKDTSGLLIVAKNDKSHKFLAAQIKEHTFSRIYETIVTGNIKTDNGTINAPIGRHPKFRTKMAVTNQNSREAITHYEVIKRYNSYTHLRVKLQTGRTHQIRVHMAYIGHPVLGDTVYGKEKQPFKTNGQILHARQIIFEHPSKGEINLETDLPDYFKEILNKLDKLSS